MSIALLQKGTGGALCVYAGPMSDVARGVPDTSPPGMPPRALAALGAAPCVVCASAAGSETPEQILAYAEAQTGRRLWWAALIGFSRGCERVRELWLAGARPAALVLADGMAAQFPPTEGELDYTEEIVRVARAGILLLVITHTYVALGAHATSTATMAQVATGWELDPPPRGLTVRRIELPARPDEARHGGLIVYSTGTGPVDRVARAEQATAILPIALAAHVRPLVDLPTRPLVTPAAAPASTWTPPWEYVIGRRLQWPAPADDPSAAAPSHSTTPSARRTPARAGSVLLIGDSLAQGLWPHLAETARTSGLAFQFKGRQGSTIRDWLSGSALADALAAGEPTVALVCLGTNDMAQRDICRAGQLIQSLRRKGHRGTIAWIGPPQVPFDSGTFRSALASQCRFRDVRLFDSQALELERVPDRIHMTPSGYRAWAESIAAWVPFAALSGAPLPSAGPRQANVRRAPVGRHDIPPPTPRAPS